MGQIVGGSLGGGVASSHGDAVSGYRVAYLVFAGVAVAATLLTTALASRRAERAATRRRLKPRRAPCLECEDTWRR